MFTLRELNWWFCGEEQILTLFSHSLEICCKVKLKLVMFLWKLAKKWCIKTTDKPFYYFKCLLNIFFLLHIYNLQSPRPCKESKCKTRTRRLASSHTEHLFIQATERDMNLVIFNRKHSVQVCLSFRACVRGVYEVDEQIWRDKNMSYSGSQLLRWKHTLVNFA